MTLEEEVRQRSADIRAMLRVGHFLVPRSSIKVKTQRSLP